MILPLLILLSSLLFSTGLFFIKKYFFRLALHTMAMLNTILDTHSTDQQKQQWLILNLRNLLISLFTFLILIVVLCLFSLLTISIYTNFDLISIKELDLDYLSYGAMLIGGIVPFLFFSRKSTKGDYSEWSKLLHRMILDNSNVAKLLFTLEKKIFSSKIEHTNSHFVIVSGLARSGTSALATLLYECGIFHSLTYANMPFLLCPNTWKKIYQPSGKNKKERAHGDQVLFSHNSIEALEEFFFKTHLHDSFIKEKTLCEHILDKKTYTNYLQYQQLVQERKGTTYLAKNNNFILRYRSMRSINKDFKVVFLFRNPIEHAYSLFKQHQRFCALHQVEPFSLDYMNWLGHHEFGSNIKHFQFATSSIPNHIQPDSMDYWLHTWINYYTFLLNLEEDSNRMLLQYEDFLHEPRKTFQALSKFINIPFPIFHIELFKKNNSYTGEVNPLLRQKSMDLYAKLMAKKIQLIVN